MEKYNWVWIYWVLREAGVNVNILVPGHRQNKSSGFENHKSGDISGTGVVLWSQRGQESKTICVKLEEGKGHSRHNESILKFE